MDVDVGPFGGKGGSIWDDGRNVGRSVNEIIVKYDQCIHSITVAYNHKGTLVSRVQHGRVHGGSRIRQISLDSPEEYLIGVAVFADDFNGFYVIHSLMFTTNKRKLKTIGEKRGDFFNCAVEDYGDRLHISSFSGRSGSYLDAIGFHLSPLAEAQANPHEPMDVGPFGGNGGSIWDDGRDVGGVKEITVQYNQCINYITVDYNHNSTSVYGVRHGQGHGGSRNKKISLEFPEEYLIGVAGFAADFNGMYVIHSLTFTTNKKRYPPIGEEHGDFFNCAVGDHGDRLHISSFSGRSGSHLDAIGFHLSPLPEEAQAEPLEPMDVDVGPFGGNGGSIWDDGRDVGGVKEITVQYNQCINYITVDYNHNSTSVSGVQHGQGHGGSRTKKISLEFPEEYLIGVAGFAADFNGMYVIHSLTFTTNKKRYPPIGEEHGDFFNCAVGDHGDRLHISSFSGRSGSHLDAIGFHLSPLPEEAQAEPLELMDLGVGPFGGDGGSVWDDGRYIGCGVKEIIVEHEYCINSITVVYNHNGTSVAVRHGQGHGGSRTKISLDFPKEYLICVGMFADVFNDLNVIRSLMFTTNKRRHERIGVEGGNFFYYAAGEQGDRLHISSFSGRSDLYLNAIGFHLSRLAETRANTHETVTREEVPIVNFSGISRTCMEAIGFNLRRPMVNQPSENDTRLTKKKMVKGPWGGKGGKSWDDGTYAAVKKIRVAYDENGITSFYVEYDDNGYPVSCLHGGIGGRDRITITLGNNPDEFLTSISGFTGLVGGLVVLQSLTFKSNLRTFQRIGYQNGTPFSSETDESGNDFRITGFFGRSGGLYIDAIGVHISSPTQNLGVGICKTIWEMVRNFGRTACTSPSQAEPEAQTEMVPV